MGEIDFNALVAANALGMMYGKLQFDVTIHRGELSKLAAVKNSNIKIKSSYDKHEAEAEAAAHVVDAMKSFTPPKGEGTIGFVLIYKDHKPMVVQIQNFIPQSV